MIRQLCVPILDDVRLGTGGAKSTVCALHPVTILLVCSVQCSQWPLTIPRFGHAVGGNPRKVLIGRKADPSPKSSFRGPYLLLSPYFVGQASPSVLYPQRLTAERIISERGFWYVTCTGNNHKSNFERMSDHPGQKQRSQQSHRSMD